MAVPEPQSLIDIVKPVLDTTESLLGKLSAKMSDSDTVVKAYRGSGLFSFYVPGYFNTTVKIEVTKELEEAGYQVHAFNQKIGYMPPAEIVDIDAAGPGDEGVTGYSQFLWVQITLSKKPESK